MSNDVLLSKDTALNSNSRIIENEHVSVDVTMLYDVSDNDVNFINSTIHTFLKKMPDTLKTLEQSLYMRDWDNVYKLSHSVRSSISIIKIDEMFDWVTQIEVNAKDEKNLRNIGALIMKIKEKYKFAEAILIERFRMKNETF